MRRWNDVGEGRIRPWNNETRRVFSDYSCRHSTTATVVLTGVVVHGRPGTHINAPRRPVKPGRASRCRSKRLMATTELVCRRHDGTTDTHLWNRRFDQFSNHRHTATRLQAGRHVLPVFSSFPVRRRHRFSSCRDQVAHVHNSRATSLRPATTSAYCNSRLASFRRSLKYWRLPRRKAEVRPETVRPAPCPVTARGRDAAADILLYVRRRVGVVDAKLIDSRRRTKAPARDKTLATRQRASERPAGAAAKSHGRGDKLYAGWSARCLHSTGDRWLRATKKNERLERTGQPSVRPSVSWERYANNRRCVSHSPKLSFLRCSSSASWKCVHDQLCPQLRQFNANSKLHWICLAVRAAAF